MKSRIAMLFVVALLSGSEWTDQASAQDRRWRVRQYRQTEYRPLATAPATIIPTREEIATVPAAGQGRLVGYVLNLYPTGRLARMVLSR
jgi:hypothetical protein